MGSNNLIPLNRRTKDEQRRIAKMGGIASGKVRKEKSTLRKTLESLLREKYTVNDVQMNGFDAVCLALIERAMQGDIKAFEVLRDTVGEKPSDKVSMDNTVSQETIDEVQKIIDEIERNYP